ncbi:phosphopantetheine-binding protein [Streptomyces sp. NPDC001455]|uniref:phosphopantetheine-binding protein n=1 Tax=Streptomyces sp. NPDC001455 TaxID=3154518 RepID=UPI0033317855
MIDHMVTDTLALVTQKRRQTFQDASAVLFSDLEVDSLALLEIITRLQEQCHVLIPDEVTARLRTVGDLHQAVHRAVAKSPTSRIAMAEDYLRGHKSLHHERAGRFRAASDRLRHKGLTDEHVLLDLGAGYTELDYVLRAEYGFRGRYVPADGWVDGRFDLSTWRPSRTFDWYAALEVIEHLKDPRSLVENLKEWAVEGFVLTTPNKNVVDVFAQDPTHLSALDEEALRGWGMETSLHNFYGHYQDGICAVWTRQNKKGKA